MGGFLTWIVQPCKPFKQQTSLTYPAPNSAWSPALPRSLHGAACTQCRRATGTHGRRTPPGAPEAVCSPKATPRRRTPRAAWTATGRWPTRSGALSRVWADSGWRRSRRSAPRRRCRSSWRPAGGHGTPRIPGFRTHLLGSCSASTTVRTFLLCWSARMDVSLSIDHLWPPRQTSCRPERPGHRFTSGLLRSRGCFIF